MAKSNRRRDEERRAAAAAKVAEMRRAQQAADRRKRSLTISAIAVAAVVAVVAVFVVIQARQSTPTVAATSVHGASGSYGFTVGKASAPATLVVYEDFQCPVCKKFEDTDGSVLDKLLADGTVKVEYRPIAFLDRMSSTDYSTRALNAAACVRNDSDITVWKKYHDLLFANQPAENTAGLADDRLAALAKQAGATAPAVATCISDRTYGDWVASATDASNKAGVSATPTLMLNGDSVDTNVLATPTDFQKLITDAAAANTK